MFNEEHKYCVDCEMYPIHVTTTAHSVYLAGAKQCVDQGEIKVTL